MQRLRAEETVGEESPLLRKQVGESRYNAAGIGYRQEYKGQPHNDHRNNSSDFDNSEPEFKFAECAYPQEVRGGDNYHEDS